MPKISVLMSVYNETEEQIHAAIDSVLSQTFNDFEFIIICDNPADKALATFLKTEGNKDSRIRVFINSKNIGLAMSLNEAAKMASGEYYARMDADDISLSTRFEKEVHQLETESYDFVFTNYQWINEEGILLSDTPRSAHYEDASIGRLLIMENIIHHPTVIFRASLFHAAGGYRNFPCAQDYDLWLRMLIQNCRFHMVDEVLFYYRIRSNSITAKKRLQQKFTLDYSRILFTERLKTGSDSYTYQNYQMYVEKMLKKYGKDGNKMEDYRKLLQKAYCKKKEGKIISYCWLRTFVFFISPLYRNSFILKLKIKWTISFLT